MIGFGMQRGSALSRRSMYKEHITGFSLCPVGTFILVLLVSPGGSEVW